MVVVLRLSAARVLEGLVSDPPGRDGYGLLAGAGAGIGPGSRVAGYRVEDELGQGGMAVVFRARDEHLGRTVALKVLAPALAADEGFRQRFLRESRAAAAVDDPHIIPVFEAGQAGGVLFIAMRFVSGGDVRSLLRRGGALSAGRAAGIISPVAAALDAAHEAGLVHRDVKPANMLLDARRGRPDHVYLSDFGLSKGALSSVGLTGSGVFLGTADYVSPEQIVGRAAGGQADQYALACTAFELLSGDPPFARDHGMAVIYAHLNEPPPALTSRRSGLPAAVDAVLCRALAKDPAGRYPSCGEFADALRAALDVRPYDTGPGTSQDEHAATIVGTTTPAAPGAGQADAGRTGTSGLSDTVTSPAARHEASSDEAARLASGRVPAGPGQLELTVTSAALRPGSPGPPPNRPGGGQDGGAEPPGAPPGQAGLVSGPGSRTRGRRRGVLAAPRRRVVIAAGAVIAAVGLIAVIRLVTGPSTNHHGVTTGPSTSHGSVVASPSVSHRGVVASPSTSQRGVVASPSTNYNVGWSYTTGAIVDSGPAVSGGTVYIGSWDHKVYALDAATGQLRWAYTTGDTVECSPAVSGGTVYVGNDGAELYALDAATGQLRWTYGTTTAVDSGPAVSGGIVYVGSAEGKVYALDAATGQLRWTYTTGGYPSNPAVSGGTVYVGSDNGKVYALEAATGQLRWTYTTTGAVYSGTAVSGGTVYFGSAAGKVYALNAATGQLRWTYTTGGADNSGPAVSGGTVYIGNWDHKVYALDAATGQLRWTYTTGGIVDSVPAISDGTVYIASEDHKVYALNAATGQPAP